MRDDDRMLVAHCEEIQEAVLPWAHGKFSVGTGGRSSVARPSAGPDDSVPARSASEEVLAARNLSALL
jgi:hypothetical protein